MWFYRIEVSSKERAVYVTWNTTMTYLKAILGWGGVICCLFNIVWLAALNLVALATLLIWLTYKYGNLIKWLHDIEDTKQSSFVGSRWSFSSPLVVRAKMVGNRAWNV